MSTDRPPAGRLRHWIKLAAPPLAVLGLIAFYVFGRDSTLCGFANTTGLPCPGCGMTRATRELLQGDLAAAHHHHPLVLLVFAELLGASTIWVLHRAGWIRWQHKRWVTVLLGATALLLLAVWIYRMATGTAPSI